MIDEVTATHREKKKKEDCWWRKPIATPSPDQHKIAELIVREVLPGALAGFCVGKREGELALRNFPVR
jgi:hypothetical protein